MATERAGARGVSALQRRRRLGQAAFFALFILAPPLDLFRLDVTKAQVVVCGQAWSVGIGNLLAGRSNGVEAALDLLLRGFLPVASAVLLFGWIAWRYGRLYCGWLCPHFSVVELINGLMRRASARPSIWERRPLPQWQADGLPLRRDSRYWVLVVAAVLGFAFLWALVLLTYLLPPSQVYPNLFTASLSPKPSLFLGVATLVFAVEFLLARHLFCRYGCAVGVFQSLVWMANRKGLVVGFDRRRGAACRACDKSCEHVCPMRLKPRVSKRHMFTCTECGQCIAACEQVQDRLPGGGRAPLLQWLQGSCALDASARDFGERPRLPGGCYRR